MSLSPGHERVAMLHRELGIPADYAAIRHLTFQPEAAADQLVAASLTGDGPAIRLSALAAAAWTHLHTAASHQGVIFRLVSGFRSIDRQAEIIRAKRAAGVPLDDILRLIAAPGYSEHHTGRAIDLGIPGEPPLEESFGDTAAFRWLEWRAAEFGFHLSFPRGNPHGIAYEPWHWRWRLSPNDVA